VIFVCCQENRKAAILGNPAVNLNGIDYLEVSSPAGAAPTLTVYCLNDLALSNLTTANVIIEGGESITNIGVVSVSAANNVLTVVASVAGDFSPYVLHLVRSVAQAVEDPFDVTDVAPGFDPQLAEVQFSFRAGTGPSFDCAPQPPDCPPAQPAPPPINYLAKDYGSFRTLILDRLNQLLPTCGGTSEADLGVMLAELLAYKGDLLSYQQDAIATEAYIETARSRVSLRRHARLVGYHVHDGCNARVWMQLMVAAPPGVGVLLDHTQTLFSTYAPGMPSNLEAGADTDTERSALQSGVQVFQPMQDKLLYQQHNQMSFYTWGNVNCCLSKGAVEATLKGSLPYLQPGDVLIYQEVIGPLTGDPADADLRHRCAVRLTQVATVDANGQPLMDPLFDVDGNPIISTVEPPQTPTPVTEIQWAQSDALPFPLCISSVYLDSEGNPHTATNVSVALGNVVLADHGLSLADVPLETVPGPRLFCPPSPLADRCQGPVRPIPLPVRLRPVIQDSPLTQAVPQNLAGIPANPGIVLFSGTQPANLTDSNGLVCLAFQAVNPIGWPQYFGVTAKQNQTNATNFDLAVVYAPQAGSAGAPAPIVLESFTNLSLNAADQNYAPAQINAASYLIQIPATYAPPATPPSGFPSGPTALSNTGPTNLQDLGDPPVTYLTVQATNLQPNQPPAWPQTFGIQAQVVQQEPPTLNLLVVYSPPTGGVGVNLPVLVEQSLNLPAETAAVQFNANSILVAATSFFATPDPSLSASDLTELDAADAVPAITLEGTYDETTTPWLPLQDLLGSGPLDQVFVVEVESDGTASLRFATPVDPGSTRETNGLVPPEGTEFVATYRIGNGTAGNVGADSLTVLAAADNRIQSCNNPLPASGGTDPETNDQIRRRAPQAFLSMDPDSLQRAVIPADYEAVAESNSQVDQAVASLRWTGSWYSVFIAVQPTGGGNLTPTLQATLTQAIEARRLAGQDLQLNSPQYVALQITLVVSVQANYFRSDVQSLLLQVLGNKILPNGQKGLFYPDNFTFGQTVYLSPVYAAARSVAGVMSVTATQFQPQGANTTQYLVAGRIKLGSLQIARLDNDPNYPDHGQLILVMQGGK
jgi:hypothetical protein